MKRSSHVSTHKNNRATYALQFPIGSPLFSGGESRLITGKLSGADQKSVSSFSKNKSVAA